MAQWLERYRATVFFLLMVLTIAALLLFTTVRPKPEPIKLNTHTPQPTPQASATPRPLRVYVSGAVSNPDVYPLLPDSIVKDALLAAGGATVDADLDRINLASPLSDGQHIYVPHLGEEELPARLPSGLPVSEGKININSADAAALESLPGIGPALAQRIIDHRQANGPFARIEEITEVSGIGPATFEKIKDLITAE